MLIRFLRNQELEHARPELRALLFIFTKFDIEIHGIRDSTRGCTRSQSIQFRSETTFFTDLPNLRVIFKTFLDLILNF